MMSAMVDGHRLWQKFTVIHVKTTRQNAGANGIKSRTMSSDARKPLHSGIYQKRWIWRRNGRSEMQSAKF